MPVHAAQPQWKYPLSPNVTYEGNLNMVKVSDDGRYIAAYVADENNLLYFNQNGTLLWNEHFTADRPPWISSVSIAHDDSSIAVSELVPGCCEGTSTNTTANRILLFDREGNLLWNYTTLHPPIAVAISPDSSRIYAGTDDRKVISLDRNGTIQWVNPADAPVYGLTVSGDGSIIAAAGTNPGKTPTGTIVYPEDLFMYNRSGYELWAFQTGGPNSIAIGDDNATIAVVGGKYGNLYLFNQSGALIREQSFRETGSSLAMAKDASLMVAGSAEGSVYGLDNSGTVLWSIKTPRLSRTIAIDDDGGRVVFGNGSSVKIIDRHGSTVWDYPTGAWVSSVAMSRDGNSVAAVSDAVYFFTSPGIVSPGSTPGKQEMNTSIPASGTGGLPADPRPTPATPLPAFLSVVSAALAAGWLFHRVQR